MKKSRVSVYHTVATFNRNKSFLYTLRNRNKWFFLVGDIEKDRDSKSMEDESMSYQIRKRLKEKRDSCLIMIN